MVMKKYIFLLLLLIPVISAGAHPHMWVDSYIKIVTSEEGIEGFELQWVFDNMFTAMMLNDFDLDGNKIINTEENEAVRQGGFVNLKKYGYFTHIWLNGTEQTITVIEDFTSFVTADGKLAYRFFVPMNLNPSYRDTLEMGVFDQTYYADYTYGKEVPILIEGPGKNTLTFDFEKRPEYAYWSGTIVPNVLIIKPKT